MSQGRLGLFSGAYELRSYASATAASDVLKALVPPLETEGARNVEVDTCELGFDGPSWLSLMGSPRWRPVTLIDSGAIEAVVGPNLIIVSYSVRYTRFLLSCAAGIASLLFARPAVPLEFFAIAPAVLLINLAFYRIRFHSWLRRSSLEAVALAGTLAASPTSRQPAV